MDPKPEGILTVDLTVDIDPTILLGLQFEKMRFVSELDVESVLSESDNLPIETSNTQNYFENEDSQTSDTYSESDVEEPTLSTELDKNKDIEGKEETLSDYNLNQLFFELDLSDSENEEEDEEPSPNLRERGGKDKTYKIRNQNRTNFLESNGRHNRLQIDPNRLQIDPRNLLFLSGSSFVELSSASHIFSLEDNTLSACNTNEVFHSIISHEPVSTSYPRFFEDSRASSIGSPESGYESSLTGSPPPTLLSTAINQRLEPISELDDDQFINFVVENPTVCALIDHEVPKQLIDSRENIDKEQKINEIVEFLMDASNEFVEVASPDRNIDIVPQVQNFASCEFEVASPDRNIDIVPQVQNFASYEFEVASSNISADIVPLVQNFVSSEFAEVASSNRNNSENIPVVQNFTSSELVEVTSSNTNTDVPPVQNFVSSEFVEVASSDRNNTDIIPVMQNFASIELVEVAPSNLSPEIVPLAENFVSSEFVKMTSSNRNNTDIIEEAQNFAFSELVEVASSIISTDIVPPVQNFVSSDLLDVASSNRNIDVVPQVNVFGSNELVEVVSSNGNTDVLPLVQNFEDINNFDIVLPPVLNNTRLPKLGFKLKDEAKKELRRLLTEEKFWATEAKIFKRLIEDKNNKKPVRVIYIVDEIDKQGDNRTNLHHAVLKQNMEEIYCLVEIHKRYHLPLFDLNARDKYGKTALDYAVKTFKHQAVINYLKENKAEQNVIV